MHSFSIRDIENMSGIKAHTLRIWEQRYDLNLGKRKESRHRYYDNDDLKQILRIATLYHSGFKISKIASLPQAEIDKLFEPENSIQDVTKMVNLLIEASLDFNEVLFAGTVTASIDSIGVENTVCSVLYPYMDKMGMLWLTNHVLPAQEHFSSNLIRAALISATEKLPRVRAVANITFALFTPEREEHEIPLLFINYLLRKHNVSTIYIGKNISMNVLREYCDHREISHLYFHLITNFTNHTAMALIKNLAAQFPGKKIIASGPALLNVSARPDLQILSSLQEMLQFCKQKS